MTEHTPTLTKLVAVYARVSTARQEEDGTIETQLSAVREHAQKNGYTIVREYLDDGWSGDILARPQLDQLRQDAKGKLWDAVLSYDPDRIARRYSYQELVMDELREAGIEVLFVTTPSPKTGEEKILHGVKGLFAEYERAKISERFRLGKMRKVKEGHILTTEAPYGYTYIPKQDKVHGYYVIHDEEAPVVRMIFSWVADDGLTMRGVVRKLQELQIRPRKSTRGVWSTSTLSHLLKNKTYIGEAHYGASYAVAPQNPTNTEKYRKMRKTSRRARPEQEWIKILAPAIIEVDLFNRARHRIEANFELSSRNTKNQYLLAGKIWCTCGSRRTGEGPQHGKHLYYRCSNRVSSFPLPRTCFEAGINARTSDDLVWQKLAQLMSSPELMAKQVKRWSDDKKNKSSSSTGDTEDTLRSIAKLRSEEERYTKAYGAGLFSMEQLKKYINPLRDRISSLESQLLRIREEKVGVEGSFLPSQDDINEFALQAVNTLSGLNFEAKTLIVRAAIDRIVSSPGELHVYGNIPLEDTGNVDFETIHRHRRPPERRKEHPL